MSTLQGFLLALACVPMFGCAPASFDDLTSSAGSSTACDGSMCLDASSRDASLPARDAGRDSGASPHDAALPPSCNGAPHACEAGQQDQQMEACGACNSGVRTRTRGCAADRCSWDAWSEWSACGAQTAACTPNAVETRSASCTTCGSRNQKRTCSASCTWDAWADTSACTWCEECSRVVYCDTPNDVVANRGTWCKQEACSRPQALADCMEDVQNLCGGTTQPFYMEYE